MISLDDQPHAGRIEVFYSNEWGQFCIDLLRTSALRVVCSQIGYTSNYILYYGTNLPENSYVWIYDINCIGNESTLLECPSDVEFHVGKIHQPCSQGTAVQCSVNSSESYNICKWTSVNLLSNDMCIYIMCS